MSDSRRQQHSYNNKTVRYPSFPDASDDQAAILWGIKQLIKKLTCSLASFAEEDQKGRKYEQ